ncbi:MAG: hypothetical protein ACQXXF_04545, partial [Thermoplasmatota archaeon]
DCEDNYSEWTNYYMFSEEVNICISGMKKETYLIMAKTKDICDLESGSTTFEVNIKLSRSRVLSNFLFLRFSKKFPIYQNLLIS